MANLPKAVTKSDTFLRAVVDAVRANTEELKGLRADLARSPSQPSGKAVELREPVTDRPASPRKATAKKTAAKKTAAKKT